MLGDAYFQLRAQVGTGLSSLHRLAVEAGAAEDTQADLQGVQDTLREILTFAALGPAGGGKSTLLNTLLEREFCGTTVEPVTAGRIAVYRYGEVAHEAAASEEAVDCRRPHAFLRDFTVVEAPASASPEALGPILAGADLILFVISAVGGVPDVWSFLPRLGREALKRLIFVVWQSDRVSAEEGANAVKRLRQAMLKNLGQACPIFTGSKADRAGREKLVRWIESEVICSAARRQRLHEIEEAARATLRSIVARPKLECLAVDREIAQVRQRQGELEECEEQSQRQVAGALWALTQNFDGLRQRGEDLLREHVRPLDLLWKRALPAADFAREIEVQARASLGVQWHDQLLVLEADLQQIAAEHLHGNGEAAAAKTEAVPAPKFPRAVLEESLTAMDTPLNVAAIVAGEFGRAAQLLRWPAFGAAAVVLCAIGMALAGRPSRTLDGLAGLVIVFVLVLAWMLRRNVVANFGRHFTANRAALLTALEPPLGAATKHFFTDLAPTLETRAAELAAERARYEPMLVRLQQIEETFSRIEGGLRAGAVGTEGGGEQV